MSFENIPDELKTRPQWVAWKMAERGGKKTKLPVNPKSGRMAKSDDPATWGTFAQAVRSAKQLDGIGYVFSADDPYCGIDLDGHIDKELIGWFGSYAERSQSGKGAHIIVRATLGEGRKTDRYEAYDRLRYFVMTGDVLHDGPISEAQDKLEQFVATVFPKPELPITGNVDLSKFLPLENTVTRGVLELIRASAQADKFESLWRGDFGGYESQSQADAALLSILRFWTGGNKAESFRLFSQSGLCRDKWTKRADYRERTWNAIDSGAVYEPPPVVAPQIVTRNIPPWRRVKIDDVLDAIGGSVLQPLVAALRSPMDPLLPPEIGLVKALVLAGCAMAEKRTEPRDGGNLAVYTQRGADLARVRIMTAGGQVANILAMVVAESAIGKDVGNILDRVAHHFGWMIGTAGSEEGIADAYIAKPNGLLTISEFANWLDKRHWQSKAAGFLTHAFNKGWFIHAMSRRSDAPPRETNYCFPCIYAAIQPGAIQTFASRIDLETGFLGRFLVAEMPAGYFGCPIVGDLTKPVADCVAALETLRAKDCDVIPPHGYNRELAAMFLSNQAVPGPTWRRLVNEYYPRFATLLSVANGDASPRIELTDEAWRRAGILVQYFFAQAEAVLTNIHEDQEMNRFESLCRRILTIIGDNKRQGVSLSTINNTCGLGTRVSERREILQELESRGLIRSEKRERHTFFFHV